MSNINTKRHQPHHVFVDHVNVLKNGWATGKIDRNDCLSGPPISRMDWGKAPSRGDEVAIPPKVFQRARSNGCIFCKVVPNQHRQSREKWFATFCESAESRELSINRKSSEPWESWQDGHDAMIIKLPSTEPGSAHNGINFACWKCGNRIVSFFQILRIKDSSVWTKTLKSQSAMLVSATKDWNDIKGCHVQKVRCKSCDHLLGSYYESRYEESEAEQDFPCFKLTTAWERRKWNGDVPYLTMVLVGKKADVEEGISNLTVSEGWEAVKHLQLGGRLDKATYTLMEEAKKATHALKEAEAAKEALKEAEERVAKAEEVAKRAKEAENQFLKAASALAPKTNIVWECQVDGSWIPFPAKVNVTLEKNFNSTTMASYSLNGTIYEVDFSASLMEQKNYKTGYRRKVRRREEIQDMPFPIVWEYEIGSAWLQYQHDICQLLEFHFHQKSKAMFILSGKQYEVDFQSANMEQVNTETMFKRPVRRRKNATTTGVPTTWCQNPPGQNCKLVQISKSSEEWKMVEKRLTKTIQNATLLGVVRVQNLHLWEYFSFRRDRVAKLSGMNDPNAVRVWHGTRQTDPMVICKDEADGFMMQHSRRGMWGRGIYFADNASYSNSYANEEDQTFPPVVPKPSYSWYNKMFSTSPPSNDVPSLKVVRAKTLILANLVVGEEVDLPSDSSLKHCPTKPGDGKRRYDTVTGITGGSKVYIVYENGRAYPEYLVTYAS